jgi:hypothetical protein
MTRASFPSTSSSRDAKISTEECSSGVMWASFQIDLNHFLLGLVSHGRQPDVRQNSDNSPRFIGCEVPAEAVAGSRLPSVTSADICTLVLDFNAHSLSFYRINELARSIASGRSWSISHHISGICGLFMHQVSRFGIRHRTIHFKAPQG